MPYDPKHAASEQLNPQELWNEISFTRTQVGELAEQARRDGDLGPVTRALDELKFKTSHYQKLLEDLQAPVRAVLGRNFLGIEEWMAGFGVHVGVTPPIPQSITAELLDSACPLHPGEKIKDTHLLILMPDRVNGAPYSALKLAKLCATRAGSGEKLINAHPDWLNEWKTRRWAKASPSASEWVLIPKSDPDDKKVPKEQHFRNKNIAKQADVYKHYAKGYREAKALEVMTAAILNYVVNGEKILGNCMLRTAGPTPSDHGEMVGNFGADGVWVHRFPDYTYNHFGGSLIWKT